MSIFSGCGSMKTKPSLILKGGDLDSGKLIVPYYLNNQLRQFSLDTGASFSHVNFDDETAKLTVVGEIGKFGAAGVKKTGDKVRVESIKISNLSLKDVDIGRFKDARKDNLGNDLFLNRAVELKLSTGEILFPEVVPVYPHRVSFELLAKNQIRFPIKFSNNKLKAIFDTGAELNSIDSHYVKKHPELFDFVQNIDGGSDITGSKVVMKLYKIKQPVFIEGQMAEIGNLLSFDFGGLRDYFGPDAPIILGVNTIRSYDWVVDYKNKVLQFKAIK